MITVPPDVRKRLAGVRFIDECCGIGAFSAALESCGAQCVHAADIDPECRRMHARNFGTKPVGDLTKIDVHSIPSHAVLTCGLPCQPFSTAGLKAGFDDSRGRVFREIHRIIAFHKPLVVLIENVPNLTAHDGGRSFTVLKLCLQELGYDVARECLNASEYSIPQSRWRIYLVAVRRDLGSAPFQYPPPTMKMVRLRDVLLPAHETKKYELDGKGLLDLRLYPEESISVQSGHPILIGHCGAGGQAQKVYHADGHARTITSASWGRVGNLAGKTGLYRIGDTIRCLTPREVARCFGLPDSFCLHKDDEVAVRQLGNSVVVDVVQRIVVAMVEQGILNGQRTHKRGDQ